MSDLSRRVDGLSAPQRALLARQLRTKAATTRRVGVSRRAVGDARLVRLSPGAGRDPLFFVHAVGGTVHAYVQLANHLADAVTPYGIEAGGLENGSEPRVSVEDMASAYLQLIQHVQPRGPYRLGGWSMGGLVAFEMARQLQTAGDEAALLTLLDTAFPGRFDPPLSDRDLATIYAADAATSLGLPFDPPVDFSSRPVADQLRWMAGQLSPSARGHRGQLEMTRRFAVFKANVAASEQYRPRTVGAPVLVIGAANSPNQTAGWAGTVTGECTVVRVPGDHYTLLKPPQVEDVAMAMRAALSS